MSRPLLTIAAAAAVVLAVSACSPDRVSSSVSPTASAPASAPSTAPATSAENAPATTTPAAIPASCDDLYPADLAASLTNKIPPLNDAALADFLSTENVAALELLGSGVPSLRCTWGAAGTPGLATTVATIDSGAADGLKQDLLATGFVCEDLEGGTACSFSQQTVDQSDTIRTNGETHWLGNGLWVATHVVDYDPEEYTQAVAARLQG